LRYSSCFTDGVGKCAQNVADQAAIAIGLADHSPSAIQIRIGGAKGVLSAWPAPNVKHREVFLRPSMIKFDAPDQKDIHVVRVSTATCRQQLDWLLMRDHMVTGVHAPLRLFEPAVHHPLERVRHP
jgi:hypothetical protein